ncbi:ATP-dependent DNA helicase, putative [Candida dubliniensis CD36]|uniref:DNA 3'-5' helicase n=1 Tax=Candida dubliniensis (strain CD36 / ATCC MYA-646 / CBS 7987 / NCPF 3949 / NRRL Y-17841) TaxID=573826 RepID=B9WE90_CANDC|nr:ATP-dependent DNA helicase, putative [Candida dubliniensis CD36]CAX43001.1 ATP-dependent DNA helicase, putative [Candida dubliniensis CD36]
MSMSNQVLGKILESLNANQRKAVTAPFNGRLQIIAGPGTGKTKVLISRVAYLLIAENIRPDNLIVTTFTKRAANEMIERLTKLVEGTDVNIDKLIIGTFHSICYRIIRKYGKLIDLEDYTIADERDKSQILKTVLTNLSGEEVVTLNSFSEVALQKLRSHKANENYYGLDLAVISKKISSLKSNGISHDSYSVNTKRNLALAFLYNKYQASLADLKKLDFDDCLLECHKLVKNFPVLNYIKHVLVDEFQDTNEIQLQLMYHFAKGNINGDPKYQNNVTIVGDPDQGIYAFRDAQSINFEKMSNHYKSMKLSLHKISLNENYRSTSGILNISETLMNQQKGRTPKLLKSQLDFSIKPVYSCLKSAQEEAKWIVYQISHLLSLPNSAVQGKDIAVLYRAAYQSRALEDELVKKGLPYKMIRGRAFWDRQEVIAIMDYLKVCSDENEQAAVIRTLNYPKRGLGPKTVESLGKIIEKQANQGKSVHQCLLAMTKKSGEPKIKLTIKQLQSVEEYYSMVTKVKSKLDEMKNCPDEDISNHAKELFDLIYEKSKLKQEFENDEDSSKRLNVEEVGNLLVQFKPKDEILPDYIDGSGDVEEEESVDDRNFLARFIESVGLYETNDEVENNKSDSNGNDKAKEEKSCISLSTIHGSKGLEWPVVFVQGLSEGLLPAGFSMRNSFNDNDENLNEERRCFYVAVTRTKVLLYISSYTESQSKAFYRQALDQESRFIEPLKKSLAHSQLAFSEEKNLRALYELLSKPFPTENLDWTQFYETYKKSFRRFASGEPMVFSVGTEDKPAKSMNNFGFSSAQSLMNDFSNVQSIKNSTHNKNNNVGPIISNSKNVKRAPPYIPERRLKKPKKIM